MERNLEEKTPREEGIDSGSGMADDTQ